MYFPLFTLTKPEIYYYNWYNFLPRFCIQIVSFILRWQKYSNNKHTGYLSRYNLENQKWEEKNASIEKNRFDYIMSDIKFLWHIFYFKLVGLFKVMTCSLSRKIFQKVTKIEYVINCDMFLLTSLISLTNVFRP